jgi:FkbH-like protein
MMNSSPNAVWRRHKAGQNLPHDITIALAGSMTAEPLEPWLGAFLLGRGFKNPSILTGRFNQLPQACSDPEGFFTAKPDFIVLLWRLEDIFPDLMDKPADLLAAVKDLAGSVRMLRRHFSGTIVVSTPPYPSLPAFDLRHLEQPMTGGALYARIIDLWMSRMSAIERVRILDLNGLLLKTGIDAACDPRKWFLYRQPWSELFWGSVGSQLGRIVCAQSLAAKKCIVLDADNTLWGGVIGEDGLAGIQLGNEFPGSAYREFQKYLLYLQGKGVLLAIASKNNPDDFDEVMDRHDAMILGREHIAAFEIHWESKVGSIQRIATALNIGLESIVFIDDSAKEVEEVRQRLPDVTCLLIPEETADLPAFLAGKDLFDLAEITDEDRRRTEMIHADRSRHELQETMSEEEFKAALGLEMTIFRMERQHLARIAQLVNKTNQFNLTTIRRTPDEIELLAHSPSHFVLGMELKDKYGDYGLVGVAVLEKKNQVCVIDTLLMSCRVLGRNAEVAFLAQLAKIAADWRCTVIEGRYIPTPKNSMVKELYRLHGFSPGADESLWLAAPDEVTKSPPHLQMKMILGLLKT